MRMMKIGALLGCIVSVLLFPLMYWAARHPRSGYSGMLYTIGSIAWPGSVTLMAAQGPAITPLGILVFLLAVISNGLLYAMVLGLVGVALRRVGVL